MRFNKILYNRILNEEAQFGADILGRGSLRTGIVMTTPFASNISSESILNAHIIARQYMSGEIVVSGDLIDNGYRHGINLYSLISCKSKMEGVPTVRTPLRANLKSQTLNFLNTKVDLSLHLNGSISSETKIDVGLVAQTPFIFEKMVGNGALKAKVFRLHLPLKFKMEGQGDLKYAKIQTFGSYTFVMQNTNIGRNSKVAINTDDMSVKIDDLEDLSSIVDTSEFIELYPGSNELIFDVEGSNDFEVTVIWSNRWL